MNTNFRIESLPAELFARFFHMPESGLARHNARLLTADSQPGFPCRVSLEDAAVGERVLAISHAFHEVDSPYRAEGPIFVREHAVAAAPGVNTVPGYLSSRVLSLRAYDSGAMMRAAEVVQGDKVAQRLRALFEDPLIAYIQVHNAGPGCFSCTVRRA